MFPALFLSVTYLAISARNNIDIFQAVCYKYRHFPK